MKIDFEVQTEYGVFRDALHLTDDYTFTVEEIEAMKQQRVNNWIAVVTAPLIEEAEPKYIEIDGVRYVKVVE